MQMGVRRYGSIATRQQQQQQQTRLHLNGNQRHNRSIEWLFDGKKKICQSNQSCPVKFWQLPFYTRKGSIKVNYYFVITSIMFLIWQIPTFFNLPNLSKFWLDRKGKKYEINFNKKYRELNQFDLSLQICDTMQTHNDTHYGLMQIALLQLYD